MVNQDIVGLDVAVNRALGMSIIKRLRHRLQQTHGVAEAEGCALFNNRVETAPVDQFHRDVMQPLLLTHIVNRQNGRVAQIRRRGRLALKPAHKLFVEAQLGGQHFDRHLALQQRIKGLVDAGHPATAQFSVDRIAPQLASDQACHSDLASGWWRTPQFT